MNRLRRLSWYERIRSGPSPEDDVLLQATREVSVQLDVPYWYRQILWGRFGRGGVGWMITKPVFFSKGVLAFVGVLPEVELMLPERLKGKLSLDEWKTLIAMHMVRFKAYNSGRMSKLLGVMTLGILTMFALLLLLLPAIFGRPWASILIFPLWTPAILLSLLWMRRHMAMWEFELDRNVANKFGTERVSQILEKMQNLDAKASPSKYLRTRFLSYWSPGIRERLAELSNPRPVGLPRASRISKIGIRLRAVIVLVGFATFWGSGIVAANFYARGQTTVVCVTNTCAALITISAIGYWSAILGSISMVVWTVRRFLQARRKNKP